MASPFVPFDTKQSSHIDLSMHPGTGIVEITIQFHPLNTGPYNCRVYELAPPYTGKPVLKRDWQQGQPGMIGPFGHGASLILPSGALLVAVPLGVEGPDNVTPTTMIEPGYSAPFALGVGGTSAPDPRVDALVSQMGALSQRVAQLEQTAARQEQQLTDIETALGNVSSGAGLTPEQTKILDYLVTVYLPLLG